MHIVLLHFEKIPVLHYGGIERIVEVLCTGFRDMGHKVTLMSYQGDYSIPGINMIQLDHLRKDPQMFENSVQLIPDDADIIHYHQPSIQDGLELPPYLVTLHGNVEENENVSKLSKFCVGISKNHASRHRLKHSVYNGLDFSMVKVGEIPIAKRTNFSFLGRVSLKRKGCHLAKKIAASCNYNLRIGGGRGLSFGNNKYLGHINNEQKYELLRGSRGLLFPILWEEPFGLVMIEAMASGTPVFALSRGSVPEILGMPENDSLFIVEDSVETLIDKINTFDYSRTPEDYRDYVDKYFGHMTMCEEYLTKYKLVLQGIF